MNILFASFFRSIIEQKKNKLEDNLKTYFTRKETKITNRNRVFRYS